MLQKKAAAAAFFIAEVKRHFLHHYQMHIEA
jgi:hypothetical protein